MRIIAGQYRRRIIHALDGLVTRPMPDRVRESLFAMLGTRVQKASVLDLFAGSGAIGLEALSRGAASCLFVERDRAAAAMLDHNISLLGCGDRARVVLGDALGMSVVARAPRPLDLAFLDPPYPLVKQAIGWDRVRQQATALAEALAPDGFLVLRTPWPFEVQIEGAPGEGESNQPAESEDRSDEAAGGAHTPAEGESAPPGVARSGLPPRSKKKQKYKRDRPRWHEMDEATRQQRLARDGSMRRGSEGPESPLAGLAGRGVRPPGKATSDSADMRSPHGPRGPQAPRGLHGSADGRGSDVTANEAFDLEDDHAGTDGAGDAVVVHGSPAPPVPAALVRPGDLKIPSLRGPETHAYGTTAVHWYMKA